jgi:hypothetical protein
MDGSTAGIGADGQPRVDINKDILRWVLLIAATPLWLPFLRILWRDFNRALEDEGGIFGKPPPAREADRIRREKASDPEVLVSERWARRGEQARPRMQSPSQGGAAAKSGRSPARRTAPGTSSGSSSSTPRFRSNPRSGGERGGGFR